jgi:FlaA1/EpsC-like NDP-sugar epimerase
VLGPIAELPKHVQARGVQAIVICVPSATGTFVHDIVKLARAAGIRRVRIVPPMNELVEGRFTFETTREVGLEDLLGRQMIRIDEADLQSMLRGKNVLITGGAGTIGSELARQVARFAPSTLVIMDVDETRLHDTMLEIRERFAGTNVHEAFVDVRDREGLGTLFDSIHIDIVFHAAAYKHVPMMQKWPLAALEVNVLGTQNVLDAAETGGADRFVLISTDKAVEPSNIMGASKNLAERLVFARNGSMMCSAVRFGNVIGSRGSVLPTFIRQLRQGGPITVTHPEVERFFMTTSEAVSLVLQAAALGRGGELFVLDMGKPVRILEIAREVVRMHGLEPDVDIPIVFTGLREGEKLTEVLHSSNERLLGTKHSRIFRAKTAAAPLSEKAVEQIRLIVSNRDVEMAAHFLDQEFGELHRQEPDGEVVTNPPVLAAP